MTNIRGVPKVMFLNKTKCDKSNVSYNIISPEKWNPRVIIYDVPADAIVDFLFTENCPVYQHQIQLIKNKINYS